MLSSPPGRASGNALRHVLRLLVWAVSLDACLPAETPSYASCDPSSFHQNVSFNGGKIFGKNGVQSAAECCSLCSEYRGCVAWTWHSAPAQLTCNLKSANHSSVHEAGHVSGNAPPAPAPPPVPPPSPPSPAPPGSPNIVFVLTDDQDGMLNGYDPKSGVAHMAQLNNRVRKNGMLFTNYYLAYPLCSPSRSAILTGRFPHNTGFTDNSKLNSSLFHPTQEAATVNTWLAARGYETVLIGKYMNGYHGAKGKWAHYVPPGWTSWYGFQTVDFFGTQVNVNGVSTAHPMTDYQTDIIANYSIDWLRNKRDRSKPFFMMLTPHAPHAPYTPAPRHAGTLANLTQPADPAFNMPTALQKLLPGNLANLPLVDAGAMNDIFERRAESLLAVDEMIGGVLDELREQGVQQNTFFFFSCDNGYHLGQHRMPPGKREIFQHDVNVPLIVSGPGIAAGSVSTTLYQNIDLARTWAALAKVPVSPSAPPVDGKSMAAELLGKSSQPVRGYSLHEGYQSCEAGHGEGKACSHTLLGTGADDAAVVGGTHDEIPPHGVLWPALGRDYSGLRLKSGDHPDAMYVEYTDGGRAYFNCTADPWQTTNAYPTLSADVKSALAATLAKVVNCAGTDCP